MVARLGILFELEEEAIWNFLIFSDAVDNLKFLLLIGVSLVQVGND